MVTEIRVVYHIKDDEIGRVIITEFPEMVMYAIEEFIKDEGTFESLVARDYIFEFVSEYISDKERNTEAIYWNNYEKIDGSIIEIFLTHNSQIYLLFSILAPIFNHVLDGEDFLFYNNITKSKLESYYWFRHNPDNISFGDALGLNNGHGE